jgi:hypothetical protein
MEFLSYKSSTAVLKAVWRAGKPDVAVLGKTRPWRRSSPEEYPTQVKPEWREKVVMSLQQVGQTLYNFTGKYSMNRLSCFSGWHAATELWLTWRPLVTALIGTLHTRVVHDVKEVATLGGTRLQGLWWWDAFKCRSCHSRACAHGGTLQSTLITLIITYQSIFKHLCQEVFW